MRHPALILILLLVPAGSGLAQVYSTNFDGTENPLSEAGAWSHHGLDWTVAQKVNGVAYGTQTGDGGYDDSYACLSGFPADQSGAGVIQRVAGDQGIHEVEILLRWSDSAHRAQGYECNLSYDGSYAQIVRWNGPFGDFTYIGWAPTAPYPHTGDTFSASITGDLIIASYNGVEIMRATDDTYATGQPGVGFFIQSNHANGDLGFTSYTAMGMGVTGWALPVPGGHRTGTFPHIRLLESRPNPVSEGTWLRYETSAPELVDLGLYDLCGREVRAVLHAPQSPGEHALWCHAAGLSSGLYLIRLAAGGEVATRKILVVR